MCLRKSITKLPVQQITVIGLITVITWLVAALGWQQALRIVNEDDFFREQIHLPSFFSSLLVLPLPYGVYRLFTYLLQQYPRVPWRRLFNNFIISALLLIIATQVFVVGVMFYLGIAGGALDFMPSWQTGIFVEALLYALPSTILMTLIDLMIFLGFEEKSFAYWLLLPALLVNGMTFFRLGFLSLGIPT